MAGEIRNGAIKTFTRIPAKWKDYTTCGKVIPGERLISFKTPLSEEYHCTGNEKNPEDCLKDGEEFTPTDLCEIFQKRNLILGLVVDFTNTKRYYNAREFTDLNIDYKKIKCVGKIVPPETVVHRFKATLLSHFKEHPDSESVVGIHCTHGLNRAGYIVCRYLIECRGYSPQQAIEAFNKARGHEMERENYLEDLLQRKSKILSEEDIERLIETSPPTDDEYQPDQYWNRDYPDGSRVSRDYPDGSRVYRNGNRDHPRGNRDYPRGYRDYPRGNRDYRHRNRGHRHNYRDRRVPFRPAMKEPRGYTGGNRGYQWTSEDYYMEPEDDSLGYDGDVNYEDERKAGRRSSRDTRGYQSNKWGHYGPHMDEERSSYDEGQSYESDDRHDLRPYHERFHRRQRRREYRRDGEDLNAQRHRYLDYGGSSRLHDEKDKSSYRERDNRQSRRMRNSMPSHDYR